MINIKEASAHKLYGTKPDLIIIDDIEYDVVPQEDIKEKAKTIMSKIDDLEEAAKEDTYEALKDKIKKVWTKIKDSRKSGLDSEGGEFSTGNLVFKLLRRNNYIGKIMKLKREAYDKQFN